MFQFRVLWIWIRRYLHGCVGCLEVVIVYVVGRLDYVAFVSDVQGLAFLWVEVHVGTADFT